MEIEESYNKFSKEIGFHNKLKKNKQSLITLLMKASTFYFYFDHSFSELLKNRP